MMGTREGTIIMVEHMDFDQVGHEGKKNELIRVTDGFGNTQHN